MHSRTSLISSTRASDQNIWSYNTAMTNTWRKGLIQSRGVALFALCFTGFVAVLSLRVVLLHPNFKSDWLDFRFLGRARVGPALGIFFYFCLLWIGIWFYRAARSKERILIACIFVGMLLYPIQRLSVFALVAVNYVQAIGNAVAFLIAIHIFLGMRTTEGGPLTSRTTKSEAGEQQ
jgi:hypothetical protein